MKTIQIFTLSFWCLISLNIYAIKVPEFQMLRQRPDTLGLYEKFEVSFNINNGNEYVNPFDPDEIDISADFTSPSGKKWKIPGFYYYSMGTLWKVRFSPNETGVWSYIIRVKDKGGVVSCSPMKFVVRRSPEKGPLVVAENNRYLKYSDGSDFYGVGLWYNDNYTTFNRGMVNPEELDNLKSLGVNFIGTYITPLETPGSGLGRYDQNICGRLDELLEMLEERDMLLSLNIWFHSYLSETVWGGGNIRWHTNPYQQVTSARDFYRSETAWKYQEKLYRYIIARWGYSNALALWFIVDEVNGTDGWVSGDSLAASDWGRKVHDYFKANDPWNHPTTGTRSGGIKEYWHKGYQTFDIAAREIYEAQGFPINRTSTIDSSAFHPLTYSYRNYAGQNQKLWNGYGKPVINGETGWDHTFYEATMPGYLAMYHNALWVTLATGSAMTPFWWSHSRMLNDLFLSSRITSIRKFTDRIQFSKLSGIAPAEIKSLHADAYAMKSNELVFGWIVNSGSDVAGEKITVSSLRKGRYKLMIYHTWRGAFLQEKEISCPDGKITFGPPYMRISGGHANYIGQDMAFILEYLPGP